MHAETRTGVVDSSTWKLVDPNIAAATATGSASEPSAATDSPSIEAVHDRIALRHQPTFRCTIAAPNSTTTLVRRIAVSTTNRRPADPVNRARHTGSSRLTLTPAT